VGSDGQQDPARVTDVAVQAGEVDFQWIFDLVANSCIGPLLAGGS